MRTPSWRTRSTCSRTFLKEFFADHCKTYKKRPIYWLSDSGRKNGFKALIYMHRYTPDLFARVRTDYVHEQQERYRARLEHLKGSTDTEEGREKVCLGKEQKRVADQAAELLAYEERVHRLADERIAIALDDGVKVNYAKFQDVLAKIK